MVKSMLKKALVAIGRPSSKMMRTFEDQSHLTRLRNLFESLDEDGFYLGVYYG